MPLLREYVLTPDVLDTRYYPHEEAGTASLSRLKEVFVNEGLLRNLCGGEWLNIFNSKDRPWHRHGKEIIKKMKTQNRLRLVEAVLKDYPTDDVEWCREALSSHYKDPTSGIISTCQVVNELGKDPALIKVERLDSSPFWKKRSVSVRLTRTLKDYIDELRMVILNANSIMFIDPHLDPNKKNMQMYCR